jgi:hypothetical protein
VGFVEKTLSSLNSLLRIYSSSIRHCGFPKIHPENHLRTLVHDEATCLGLIYPLICVGMMSLFRSMEVTKR